MVYNVNVNTQVQYSNYHAEAQRRVRTPRRESRLTPRTRETVSRLDVWTRGRTRGLERETRLTRLTRVLPVRRLPAPLAVVLPRRGDYGLALGRAGLSKTVCS